MAYTRQGDYSNGKVIGTSPGQQNLNSEFDAVSTETQAIRGVTVTAGTGLTGGGDLTANRTLAVANGGVGTTQLADAGVTAAKLASDAVETAKIKDANVTVAKLAPDAVETAKVKDGAITTAKVADGAVTSPKLDLTARSCWAAGASTSDPSFSSPATTLVYNVESVDQASEYDATTGIATIAANGVYLVTACAVLAGNVTRVLAIYKNSTEVARFYSPNASGSFSVACSAIIQCSAGDQISVKATCSSTATFTRTQAGGNWFCGYRLV